MWPGVLPLASWRAKGVSNLVASTAQLGQGTLRRRLLAEPVVLPERVVPRRAATSLWPGRCALHHRLGVGHADLPRQQLGITERDEPPPKAEPAKPDRRPFGHIGLGRELDVDDAANAAAVKVHNDTSLPVEPVVGGGMGVPSGR